VNVTVTVPDPGSTLFLTLCNTRSMRIGGHPGVRPSALGFSAVLLVSLLALPGCKKEPPSPVTAPKIAAAADLAFAFEEVGTAYARATGVKPVFTFGSTGLLAKQLEQGAPFDGFAAANVSFVERVVAAGACDGTTKTLYARGRLVLWAKSGVALPARIEDIADPRFVKIAIANPEHAPYGKAAREALERSGVWPLVEKRVVFGENVQQTLKFAQTGNAEVAIVALSLAVVTKDGGYLPIDPGLHAPLDQALVACNHGAAKEAGKSFGEFVSSAEGRTIMKRHGFLLSGEVLAGAR
jgi:molybdate transport system substrate-binding protein